MTIEELLKALDLEGEDSKEKADILKKEFKDKENEFNEVSKKLKEAEKSVEKLTGDAEKNNPIVDKFNIVATSFGLDLEAEDFDKMLDEVKDKLAKDAGNGVTPEEVKQLKRDLTKANRELEKSQASLKEVTEQFEAEKATRITAMKRDVIKKELEAVNALNPGMFVDLFLGKVEVDKDGKTLTMKDAAGNDISVADGIADWAKENTDLVKKSVRGGMGSGGSTGTGSDGVSDFVKNMIAERANNTAAGGDKPLSELFG